MLPFLIPLGFFAWAIKHLMVPFSNWTPLAFAVWATIEALCCSLFPLYFGIWVHISLSHHVLVAYRHILASAISVPVAFVLERKQRPPLSLSILVKIFFLALVGITIQQNIFFAGIRYTSPTVAGALSCVIPAFTFILAMLLRMEKVRIRTAKGRTKILGTLVCVTGAMVFTFGKGLLFKGLVKRPLIVIRATHFHNGREAVNEDWVKGSLVILTSHIIFSAWIVFQGVIFEEYPARLSLNALMCCFTSLQSSVEALIFERNRSSWQLGWNIQLIAVIYTGFVISFLVYNLQAYCISVKGPLFSAIFYPLMLVIMGIFSAISYAERLHLGRIVQGTLQNTRNKSHIIFARKETHKSLTFNSDESAGSLLRHPIKLERYRD